MTYRERREARADRLREWAAKRYAKSSARFDAVHRLADSIPLGQPILVGHHSEKHARKDAERIHNGMRAAIDDQRMADSMTSRADSIERAADHAIYSDDPDAAERLAERIAELEGQRERIKAYNATARKGKPDTTLLDDAQRADLLTCARFAPIMGKGGAFPAYKLTNLGGNITRLRERLKTVNAPKVARSIYARRPGKCEDCREAITPGDLITETEPGEWVHGRCHEARHAQEVTA